MNIFRNISNFWNEEILKNGVWNCWLEIPYDFINDYSNTILGESPFQLKAGKGLGKADTTLYISSHIINISEIPSSTIEVDSFKTLMKESFNVPGNVSTTTNLALEFIDVQKAPIAKIINAWYQGIQDALLGKYNPKEGGGKRVDFRSLFYGNALIWMMNPSGDDINLYSFCDCIYPLKEYTLPGLNGSTNDKVQISFNFNANLASTKPWVKELCEAKNKIYRKKLVDKLDNLFKEDT